MQTLDSMFLLLARSVCAFAFLLLSACTSLSTLVPVSSPESPRTNGSRWKWGLGIESNAAKDLEFTSDASLRPARLSNPKLTRSDFVSGRVGMGLAEPIDVFLKVGWTKETIAGFKVQWLGGSLQNSKEGDLILTTVISASRGGQSRSGDQLGQFGPGGYNWNSSITMTAEEYCLLVGYMMSSEFLLYGGGYFSPFRISGSIEHKQSDNGTSPAAFYSLGASGRSTGPKLGLEFALGPRAWLFAEGVLADFEWSGVRSETALQAHLALRTIF